MDHRRWHTGARACAACGGRFGACRSQVAGCQGSTGAQQPYYRRDLSSLVRTAPWLAPEHTAQPSTHERAHPRIFSANDNVIAVSALAVAFRILTTVESLSKQKLSCTYACGPQRMPSAMRPRRSKGRPCTRPSRGSVGRSPHCCSAACSRGAVLQHEQYLCDCPEQGPTWNVQQIYEYTEHCVRCQGTSPSCCT